VSWRERERESTFGCKCEGAGSVERAGHEQRSDEVGHAEGDGGAPVGAPPHCGGRAATKPQGPHCDASRGISAAGEGGAVNVVTARYGMGRVTDGGEGMGNWGYRP
jgi:hypothetical protein